MMLKKLAVAACVMVSLGVGTGSGVLAIRRVRGQDRPAGAAAATEQGAKPVTPQEVKAQSKPVEPLVQRLLAAARQRLDAQRAYYEEGRITIDRFLDACAQLEKAELLAAADERERMAARQKYVALLTEILNREQAELLVGRGTVADVAEAAQHFERAGIELMTARGNFDQYDAKAQRLVEVSRQRYDAQEAYYKEGRITIDRIADASKQLGEAELRTARTDYERIATKKRHLDRLKAIEAREEGELKAWRSTRADMAEASTRRIEAELDLHEAINNKGTTDLSPVLRRLGELERKVEQLQKVRSNGARS